jgi:hypothetical protein
MRRTIFACLGVAAAFVTRPLSAATFAGDPPIIGDQAIVALATALDAEGGRYVAGVFYSVADFDPGKGVQNRTAHGPGATPFVSKFSSTGAWVWTQTFGGTGTDLVTAIAVANGVVYVAGSFDSNDAGFGAAGTISAHSDANNFGAGFVIAVDAATGAPRSSFHQGTGAQTFGGSGGGRAAATALLVVGSNLYVAGTFDSLDFGIGGSGAIDATGQTDAFVAAIDTRTGESVLTFGAEGVQTFGGNGNENARGLASANGVLYVGGDTSSTNFGIGGTGAVSTGALYDVDAFVAALDVSTGAKVSAFGGDGIVTFGASGSTEDGWGVATAGGVVYLVGTANGAGAKIDGAGAAHPTYGGRDVFVLAVDAASGAPTTAFAGGLRFFGGTQNEGQPTAIAAMGSRVYVAGYLGTADAGLGGAGAVEKADAYVLALDAANGDAVAAFGGDGVQTINGGDPSGLHQAASITGFAASPTALCLVGQAPVGGYFGPPASKTNFPGVGTYLLQLDPATAEPLNLTGSNHRPVFSTPVIATPNPAVAGKPVKFMAVATDADRNPLHFAWDFGDATTSKAKSPSKKFGAADTYTVSVTADDGKGGSTAGTAIDLVVLPANTPYFDVTKASVSLKFSAPVSDTVTVSGQIPLADGTSLEHKLLTLNVGDGAQKTFALNVFGKSRIGNSTVSVGKPKGGVAKFSVKLANGDYRDVFFDENMTDVTVKARYAPTVVTVVFDGATYAETVPLFWTAKLGKGGVAK